MAQEEPLEFYSNNKSWFEEKQLTSFEINNALKWHLLVKILQEGGKLISINEMDASHQILVGIKDILSLYGFNVHELIDEFEANVDLDSENLLSLIASKLKLLHSIELLNVWVSDDELKILAISTSKWLALEYPFVEVDNGFGKIHPIASNQSIEEWLLNN